MRNLSYQIFVNNKNLSLFAYEKNWLIGLTAQKKEQLLEKIKPLVNTSVFDEKSFGQTIGDFIEWYRDDYFKTENEICPDEDDEIVESVGIIRFNNKGEIAVFTYGRFGFYALNNGKTALLMISESINEKSIIVADPKKAGIAESVMIIENESKLEELTFPFALIRPKVEVEKKRNYWKPIIAFLIGLGILTWAVRDTLFGWIGNKNLIDSTTIPVDSSYISDTPEIDSASMASFDTSIPTIDTVYKFSAEEYFEKAEKLLQEADSLMAEGINAQALDQLESASTYFLYSSKLDPEFKQKVEARLSEIALKRGIIK